LATVPVSIPCGALLSNNPVGCKGSESREASQIYLSLPEAHPAGGVAIRGVAPEFGYLSVAFLNSRAAAETLRNETPESSPRPQRVDTASEGKYSEAGLTRYVFYYVILKGSCDGGVSLQKRNSIRRECLSFSTILSIKNVKDGTSGRLHTAKMVFYGL
jgi:hypothetical protein